MCRIASWVIAVHITRPMASRRMRGAIAIVSAEPFSPDSSHERSRPPPSRAPAAARLRFRPILMTAFSFILGVIPLLVASGAGAASRQSLGTAVFGGMLVATVTGVFFIPVLYVVVMHTVARLTGKSKAGTGSELESGAEA